MDADKDMTILQLGAGPEIAIALQNGQIAAAVLSYRNALSFLERGWPILVNLTQTGFKYPPSCVASSRAFIGKNPDTVDGFLKAYVEAIHTIKKDLNLTKRVYAKYYRESDAAVTDKVISCLCGTFQAHSECARRRHRGRGPGFRLPTTAAKGSAKDQPLQR